MADKSPEQMAREGAAHRDRTAPNCAACNCYHGSENVLYLCLTREVIRLKAFEADVKRRRTDP